jgi:hypothetical protein
MAGPLVRHGRLTNNMPPKKYLFLIGGLIVGFIAYDQINTWPVLTTIDDAVTNSQTQG